MTRAKTELTMRHLDASLRRFKKIEQQHVLIMGDINKINRRLAKLEGVLLYDGSISKRRTR